MQSRGGVVKRPVGVLVIPLHKEGVAPKIITCCKFDPDTTPHTQPVDLLLIDYY
jgi:hypothetical protein